VIVTLCAVALTVKKLEKIDMNQLKFKWFQVVSDYSL